MRTDGQRQEEVAAHKFADALRDQPRAKHDGLLTQQAATPSTQVLSMYHILNMCYTVDFPLSKLRRAAYTVRDKPVPSVEGTWRALQSLVGALKLIATPCTRALRPSKVAQCGVTTHRMSRQQLQRRDHGCATRIEKGALRRAAARLSVHKGRV